MGIIDSYVKLVEQTYSIKVVSWNYDHANGWNPMVIRLQDDQLKQFLKNFGGNGGRNGVKYHVTLNGDVKFISLAGQLIENLLETVTGKRRNREKAESGRRTLVGKNGRVQRTPEQFARQIQVFYSNHQEVIVEYFDGHNTLALTGTITSVDLEISRIKCSHPSGVEWIPLEDILRIELVNEKD